MPSNLVEEVLSTLKEIFPFIQIKLEYPVKYKNRSLYVDIFLPQLNIAIEVHGQQHFKFVKHFHSDANNFRQSKIRDKLKEEWAYVSNFKLVIIKPSDFPMTKDKLLGILDVNV